MNRRATSRVLLAAALGLAAEQAIAIDEVLTPASYFECQIAAQQATLVGVQERAARMRRTDISEADKRAAGEQARHRVTLAIYGCGKQTAGLLGAYANRHADELQTYLAVNPQVRARLEAVGKRIAALSQQMSAASPSVGR